MHDNTKGAAQYNAIPCLAIRYHAIPCHTIPYHTIPYHTIPYHTIPFHTIPYNRIWHSTMQNSSKQHGTVQPTRSRKRQAFSVQRRYCTSFAGQGPKQRLEVDHSFCACCIWIQIRACEEPYSLHSLPYMKVQRADSHS